MQFILQHQQEQHHVQQQPDSNSNHLTSVEHYPIYSSNHLDARPIPGFFTQPQKPHFLLNLLQGFQKPWELTTTKPTFVYMNSRPLASQTTSQPPRPALSDSSAASSQSVSQITGYRGNRFSSKCTFSHGTTGMVAGITNCTHTYALTFTVLRSLFVWNGIFLLFNNHTIF